MIHPKKPNSYNAISTTFWRISSAGDFSTFKQITRADACLGKETTPDRTNLKGSVQPATPDESW